MKIYDVEGFPNPARIRIALAEKGILEEVFGTGTAVVVLPIHSFSHQGKSYRLSKQTPVAHQLKDKLVGIQYNTCEDPFNWRLSVD